jgi:hypothetical protein
MIPDEHKPENDQTRSDLSGARAYGDQTGSNHDRTGSDASHRPGPAYQIGASRISTAIILEAVAASGLDST